MVLADDETSVFENGKRTLKKFPKAVYVQFMDGDGEPCKWQLPGESKSGIYPIVPKRKRMIVRQRSKASCVENQEATASFNTCFRHDGSRCARANVQDGHAYRLEYL